jgi:DNA-binding MarR family transcriptional regulator
VPGELDPTEIADALRLSVGLLVRRLRQVQVPGELTMPESAALARLDRGGPATASMLARQEQISPKSMGATVAALEERGFLERRPDPDDGQRILLSPDGRAAGAARPAQCAHGEARGGTGRRLHAAAALLDRLAERL